MDKQKVTFAWFGDTVASSRLRAKIPQYELKKLGHEIGKDVLIYGKHWLEDKAIEPYKKKIYDVCDVHFQNEYGDYYRRHIKNADAVTCNSEIMKERIWLETGVVATVIKEPYEYAEKEPSIGPNLLWFGHQSNLVDIERLLPAINRPVTILSNSPNYPEWSPESFLKEMEKPSVVLIPTGKSMAKSENRMVESIRLGKYVCAGKLPAYDPFYRFFPLLYIPEHIERVLTHPNEAHEAVKEAQEYIRDRYSPATIAKQWLNVIEGL